LQPLLIIISHAAKKAIAEKNRKMKVLSGKMKEAVSGCVTIPSQKQSIDLETASSLTKQNE